MNTEFHTYGEILWDCLPSGRHAGGAPFNVAVHLAQLGASASLISAVGQDSLGDELLSLAADKGVETHFIGRVGNGLPTGIVRVTVDANGNATYELVQPVAWDEIRVPREALEAVARSRGFVFGSLAARSPYNLDQLDRLLNVKGPIKFFDVNLRPPFVDAELVLRLAKQADVLKLNDEEIGRLASWVSTGEMTLDTPHSAAALGDACAAIAQATGASRICVTRGPDGAALWDSGTLVLAEAPKIVVKDTIGAGDAFMAGLMLGLTRGIDNERVLQLACLLGAYVASQAGATPPLPVEITSEVPPTADDSVAE